MTENKRFKQVVGGVKDTRTGRTLTLMLEFTLKLNEINDLYDCVFDRNEELEKENDELKQFQGKLFNLLDKKIAQNEEAIEFGEKQGADVGAMSFHTNMLKMFRKELQE